MRADLYILDQKTLKARVRFHNNTQQTEYLYLPRVFPGGVSLNNFFQFEPRESVSYVGPLVKRKPFGEDDIITVLPAEVYISDEVDLKSLYRINSRSNLRVRYLAFHPLDGLGKGDHMVETPWEDLHVPSFESMYEALGKTPWTSRRLRKPALEI